jgi:hypothetical protein
MIRDRNKATVIESELGYLFGVADRALTAGMTDDEGDLLRTFRNMLELNGPPIMEAVAELEDSQHKRVFLNLLRTVQAAFMIGSLATRSDTGDKFLRIEGTKPARDKRPNSPQQRAQKQAVAEYIKVHVEVPSIKKAHPSVNAKIVELGGEEISELTFRRELARQQGPRRKQ